MKAENKQILLKRPRVPRQVPSDCLECGSNKGYQPSRACKQVLFRGERVELEYERMACPDCGAALLLDEQLDQSLERLVKAFQKKRGLLTADEVVSLRKSLGYRSQRAFLEATSEVTAATLKRIESGKHVQDLSTDSLLRRIFEDLERAEEEQAIRDVLHKASSNSLHISFEWNQMKANSDMDNLISSGSMDCCENWNSTSGDQEWVQLRSA